MKAYKRLEGKPVWFIRYGGSDKNSTLHKSESFNFSIVSDWLGPHGL